MTNKHHSIITAILILITLALCGCTGNKPEQPSIVVTIEPLRYFAEQIAGDKYNVTTLVPKGSNPETYEPTAQQMMQLSNSELFITVGNLGFERAWMKRFKANASHMIVVDTSEGIVPIKTSPNGASDPHTWTSPANAMQIAINIYKAMALINTKDSTYFKNNLDNLCRKIMDIDTYIDNKLKKVNHRSFIIYHPALTYFAQEYRLNQLAIEKGGREPSAASLEQTIKEAKAKDVKLMFVQREFANHNTEVVSKGVGAKVVEINPLSYDWESEMKKIADEICKQ